MSRSVATRKEFRPSLRVHVSLTAALEKRALIWMAERAPAWVTPDRLTVLGFMSQVAGGLCYVLARFHRVALLAGIVCLLLNWLGDSLDGTVARVRRQERPRYGFYVDHVVDILGATAMMCGLAISGLLHWPIAFAMLIAFLLLSAESYLAAQTLGRFELSQGLFGPTELRILLAAGNIAVYRNPWATVLGHRWLLFDVGGVTAVLAMGLMVSLVAARHTAELYRLETLQ